MPRKENFNKLYEEIKAFHRNLGKDNSERRNSLDLSKKYICKLDNINREFRLEITNFNRESHGTETVEKITSYIQAIEKYIVVVDKILKERLELHSSVELGLTGSDSHTLSKVTEIKYDKMTEKFDLKTASCIIPKIDNSENSVKSLIDAIELYDDLLDDRGKILLTQYVLKTSLSESAKLKLDKTYPSNAALIASIKCRLLTKKSTAALSLQLHNAKQNRRSIDQFGKSIEELMIDLTLAQSDGDDNAATVLAVANEKIAINAFANGLYDNEIKLIVKSRNYNKLRDAIAGAQDEEISKTSSTSQVFHFKNKYNNNFKNFRKQGRGNSSNFATYRNNYSNKPVTQNSYNRNFNYPNRNYHSGLGRNQQPNNYGQRLNFRGNQRGHNSTQNSNQRVARGYHIQEEKHGNNEEFFRSPM